MKLIQQAIAASLLLWGTTAQGQYLDSLQFTIGTTATVAQESYQPLWLVANRFGVISDQRADLSTHIRVANKHLLGSKAQLYNYLRKYEGYPEISIAYGLDLYNNYHFQDVIIQEGFVKLSYNHWQMRVGRYEEIIGEVNPELSSGSMGVSGNALPVPKVSLAVTEYTNVPLTQGWVQFKGILSHGWMEKERFVEKPYLHEKNLYVRIGKNGFHVFGGFSHFAIWGGKHPVYGKLPDELSDFKKVVFSNMEDMTNPEEAKNGDAIGNHLGMVELGFQVKVQDVAFKVYNQTPFEDHEGVNPFKDRNQLLGFSVINQGPHTFFSALTLEFLDTRGYGANPTRDYFENNYNNAIYQSGWSYWGDVIGTPLFFTRRRANYYFDKALTGSYRWNIMNNQVRSIHLGWKGYLPADLSYRTLLTYTENYGNSFNSIEFAPSKQQWYIMQEIAYQKEGWKVLADVGWDVGDLSKNIGFLLGVEYDLHYLWHSNGNFGN